MFRKWWSATAGMSAVLAMGACFLAAGPAMAASSGNPVVNPVRGGFTLSMEIGYTDRDVDKGRYNDDLSSYGITFKGTYGITQRFGVSGRVGMADQRLDEAGFTGSLGFCWGAGLMYNLYRSKNDPTLNILITGDYTRYDSKEGGFKVSSDTGAVSLLLTKGHKDLLFYGGPRASWVKLHGFGTPPDDTPGSGPMYGPGFVPDLSSSDNFGLVFGLDYGISERFYVTSELHLFDELAITGGIGVIFGQ